MRQAAKKNKTENSSIEVRQSLVHGLGVVALQRIAKGRRVIEYLGERISWQEAQRRHPHDPKQPHHTFYFHLNDELVIDGKHGGNDSRWINHSCAPNCEAVEIRNHVYIKSLRAIEPGEELFYNYGLVIEGRITKALKQQYACFCGAPNCLGTMLNGSL